MSFATSGYAIACVALRWLWTSGDITEVSIALFAAPFTAGIVVLWVVMP